MQHAGIMLVAFAAVLLLPASRPPLTLATVEKTAEAQDLLFR